MNTMRNDVKDPHKVLNEAVRAARKAIDGVDDIIEKPEHDFFVQVIGELCTLRVRGDEFRVSGRIEEVGPEYLMLRHKDQKVIIIKIAAIDLISIIPTRHYANGSVSPANKKAPLEKRRWG